MSDGACVRGFLAVGWSLPRLGAYLISRGSDGQETSGPSQVQLRVAPNFYFSLIKSRHKARRNIDQAIKMTADASKQAIEGSGCPAADQVVLEKLLMVTGRELARNHEPEEHPVRFRVLVEGRPQRLNSVVHEEVYQVGRELLRNAFRHAQANQVEAEIRYQRRLLCLHVRDDGQGIDAEVLRVGRLDGQDGLSQIHERARRIGARLDVWSKRGVGTEVKLSVPGSIAYAESSRDPETCQK